MSSHSGALASYVVDKEPVEVIQEQAQFQTGRTGCFLTNVRT